MQENRSSQRQATCGAGTHHLGMWPSQPHLPLGGTWALLSFLRPALFMSTFLTAPGVPALMRQEAVWRV